MQVTVLLTVRNNFSTIRQCVESLLSQTYKNYDIFIVDAFSTDGTCEILKEISIKTGKIRLFQLKGWPPHAYNWALGKIKSDYIALIDGDCIADKNWLKELVSGFRSKEILAVAGYCGTPPTASKLQKLIGNELESRFRTFPKFIPRAPTMNLCIRTDTARNLKFDQSLRVAYDADFGWRLTKVGKMLYNPKAKILHYHRSTLKNYFKQQYITAKFMPKLYFRHEGESHGDYISTGSMIAQPFLAYLFVLGVLLSVLSSHLIWLSLFSTIVLLSIYFSDMKRIGNYSMLYVPLFALRTVAWAVGLLIGLFKSSL